MSQLASTNTQYPDPLYSELDTLFSYKTTLVEMHPTLVFQILVSYKADHLWMQLQLQIQANSNFGVNITILLFVLGSTPSIDINAYLVPHRDGDKNLLLNVMSIKEI